MKKRKHYWIIIAFKNPEFYNIWLYKIKLEFLYIIKQGDLLHYKFGRSYEVENRIKSLQTGSSHTLIIIGKYECKDCKTLEAKIHQYLKNNNLVGEWYCLSDDDLEDSIEIIYKLIEEIHQQLEQNTCDICNFSAYKNEKYNKHFKSLKHKSNYERTKNKITIDKDEIVIDKEKIIDEDEIISGKEDIINEE